MKIYKSNVAHAVLYLAILITPIFDLLSALFEIRVTLYGRGALAGLAFLSAAILFNQRIITRITLALAAIPAISYFLFGFTTELPSTSILLNYGYVLKIVVLFSYYTLLLSLNDDAYQSIKKVTKFTLVFYSAFIVVGAVFSIEAFRSYDASARFGYKGIVTAQNEASGVILLGLLIFGKELLKEQVSKIDLAAFVLLLTASVSVGTKSGLLFSIATLLVVASCKTKKGSFLPLTISAAALVIFFGIYFLPALSEDIRRTFGYFIYQWESYANRDILTFLLSGRNNKLGYMLSNALTEYPIYLLFGGYPISSYMSELDFFDIALTLGVPAFAGYLFLLKKIFSSSIQSDHSNYYILSFLMIVFFANTSGHILISALAAPYIAVFCTLNQRRRDGN